MPDQCLNLIIAIASSLTAIGTISAVIASLMLARRDTQVRLEIDALLIDEYEFGKGRVSEGEILINVTNLGFRPATINFFSIETGLLFKKEHTFLFDQQNSFSNKLPIKLQDGDEAQFFIDINDFNSYKDYFSKLYNGPFQNVWYRFIKIKAHTSVGKKFKNRINKNLFMHLLDLINNDK